MSRLLNVCLVTVAVIVCSVGLPYWAPAQESAPVECTLTASRERVVFGDSLTVECTVTIPSGMTALDPSLAGTDASELIVPSWKHTGEDTSGSTVMRYGFLIHAFAPDTLRIGPVRGEVIGPDGTPHPYASDTVLLTVDTVLAAADTVPYPLRPPVTIAAQGMPGWIVILAILVLLLIIAGLAYRFRKRRTQNAAPTVELPLDEIEEFRNIAKLALHEKGHFKELYALISEAMRAFLHRNMPFDARHETTTEIIRELGRTGYEHTITDEIRSILLEADQVMFARNVPSWDQAASIVDRALLPVTKILDEHRRRIEAALAETAAHEHAEQDAVASVNADSDDDPALQSTEHGGSS